MLHCNMKLIWQSSHAFLDLKAFQPLPVSPIHFVLPGVAAGGPHGIESPAPAKSIVCCGQRFSAACPAAVST